ncbi:MAG TPA: glycosyltransferase family A protein [Opitutaceae bacterium]
MSHTQKHPPVVLSIGIMAWNEADSICTTLESLFRQTVFERLVERRAQCEIVVVANACTDATVAVTRAFFEKMKREHPWSAGFTTHVVDIPEPGKGNAWNRYIHEFSALEARFICSMDADIVFHHRDTIYNLMAALERNPHASASTGRQCKDVLFKAHKTLRDRISLATSSMGGGEAGKICGQLYCLRAEIARNLYLPRHLSATEDGFIKEMVCTSFLTHPSDPTKIVLAPDAAHIFEAYVSPREVLNNQKRQMIGQTIVHVLIEHLKTLPYRERSNLAQTLRCNEQRDPDWLRRLLAEHLRERPRFWQLFPGLLTFRFKRLAQQKGLRKVKQLPAACAGFVVTLVSCARAHGQLRKGAVDYWPKASRQTILSVPHAVGEAGGTTAPR